ncbi:hypothetical protein LCGC14_1872940 [marine sediment metagenome]|uniref:Uncharacterized protein n=1 Tax=marine sediment metagenome TaxID=412755 RepID=A0A0F9IIG7_9ZZZZ
MSHRYGIFRTIPAWDVKDEGFFKEKMRERFEEEIKRFMTMDFHIREIEEMDLGLENWNLPPDTHKLWSGTTWINHPLESYKAVMIYGISSPEPILPVRKIIFLKGPHGSMIIGRNDLSELKALETAIAAIKECSDQEWLMETFGSSAFKLRMEGYFQESYIYRPSECVNIGVIYLPDRDPGELKLMGYVAEGIGASIA